MAHTYACRNCLHVHPSSTVRGAAHIKQECDTPGCGCLKFNFMFELPHPSGQRHTDDTPAGALAKENAHLKSHIAELRERVPTHDPAFSSAEMQNLRLDAAKATAELTRHKIGHARTVNTVKQSVESIDASLVKINTLLAAVQTIVEKGYSAYSHPAVLNGMYQLSDELAVARQLAVAAAQA